MSTDAASALGSSGSAWDKADAKTRLAFARTALAADRTLMAWIRTAFSMISFGFTIGKFFESLNEQAGRPAHGGSARVLALLLISLGVVSLLTGVWEYRRALTRLQEAAGLQHTLRAVWFLAACVALLGILAFIGMFVRLTAI